MLCVFPVHSGDIFLLINQLRWIEQLGGCPGHKALIVADAAVQWEHLQRAIKLASKSFGSVDIITNDQPVPGWIAGSNSLWSTAAKYCQEKNCSWLFLEPDAVPLRTGWLDELETADNASDFPFLASLYSYDGPDTAVPRKMMTGIAVYPAWALDYFRPVEEAFDVQLSRRALEFVQDTPLIQQTWGVPGLPPTFRNTKLFAPRHAFTLDKLDPRAVIFHRNKCGTLIELLRAKAGVPVVKPFIVVLPVCVKDADLMIKCLDWMFELDGQNEFDCLISHDVSLGPAWMARLKLSAGRAFRTVQEFIYPRPLRENWPDACNVAFQSTAQHIQAMHDRPWVFLEPDCVPLKPDWLPALWQEYQNCGYPIAGPVIEGVGHMNGTAIYPANFATTSPGAMSASHEAWDTSMTYDIVGKVHDISRLWCHRWGLCDGKPHQSQGPPIHFSSTISVDLWIPKEAVLFHRVKDGSLFDLLRAKRK